MNLKTAARRSLTGMLVALVLALLSPATTSWAIESPTDPCARTGPNTMALVDCEPTTPKPSNAPVMPAPQPTATKQPASKPTAETKPAASGSPSAGASGTPDPSASPKAAAGSEPSTPAEQWASDGGKAMPDLLSQVSDRLDRKSHMGTEFFTIYSVTFAIGVVIFAIMMGLQISRAAHESPRARAELLEALPKYVVWAPLVSIAPAVVVWLWNDVAQPMATISMKQSLSGMKAFLSALGKQFLADPLWFLDAGGTVLVGFLLIIASVLAVIAWIIEDMVAEWGIYVLTILIPITSALALNSKWSRMMTRITGVIIGCLLTPVVTRILFWIMWLMMADKMNGEGVFFMKMINLVVIMALSCSTPIVLSYVLPNVLPTGSTTYGGQGGSSSGHVQDMMNHGQDALSRLNNGFKKSGAQEASSRAAGSRAAQGLAARGAGAEAAAGALGGPVGLALAAGAAAVASGVKALENAAKSSGAQQLAAGGGGHTSDASSNMTAPAPRLGKGGGNPGKTTNGDPSTPQLDAQGNQVPAREDTPAEAPMADLPEADAAAAAAASKTNEAPKTPTNTGSSANPSKPAAPLNSGTQGTQNQSSSATGTLLADRPKPQGTGGTEPSTPASEPLATPANEALSDRPVEAPIGGGHPPSTDAPASSDQAPSPGGTTYAPDSETVSGETPGWTPPAPPQFESSTPTPTSGPAAEAPTGGGQQGGSGAGYTEAPTSWEPPAEAPTSGGGYQDGSGAGYTGPSEVPNFVQDSPGTGYGEAPTAAPMSGDSPGWTPPAPTQFESSTPTYTDAPTSWEPSAEAPTSGGGYQGSSYAAPDGVPAWMPPTPTQFEGSTLTYTEAPTSWEPPEGVPMQSGWSSQPDAFSTGAPQPTADPVQPPTESKAPREWRLGKSEK